jgi:hypothetical protein
LVPKAFIWGGSVTNWPILFSFHPTGEEIKSVHVW